VLKASVDRRRIVDEAAALSGWKTPHVPALLAVDDGAGALLIEAIEPGTQIAESPRYPRLESLAALITSLHAAGPAEPSYERVAERVAYLYDSGQKNYERKPELVELVPPELYERGRRLATRLGEDVGGTVLLHGDLTPVNVLEGGEDRGLVAIDPAPCLGDPAFDAIDLVLWRATDLETIGARARRLAPAIGAEPERLLAWCAAFAAMTALEIAEAPGDSRERIEPFVALAAART